MLLTFVCIRKHVTKKLSEEAMHVIECPTCSALATRSYDGEIQSESSTVIDTGFMAKPVNYSEKHVELIHEQSEKHSRFVKKRLGLDDEEF